MYQSPFNHFIWKFMNQPHLTEVFESRAIAYHLEGWAGGKTEKSEFYSFYLNLHLLLWNLHGWTSIDEEEVICLIIKMMIFKWLIHESLRNREFALLDISLTLCLFIKCLSPSFKSRYKLNHKSNVAIHVRASLVHKTRFIHVVGSIHESERLVAIYWHQIFTLFFKNNIVV